MTSRLNWVFIAIFAGNALFYLNGCAPKTVIKPTAIKTEKKLFSKAESAFATGKYENALKFYGNYLDQYPDTPLAPAALMKMGRIYQKLGDYEKARNRYDKILTAYPDSSLAAQAGVNDLEILFLQRNFSELIRRVHQLPREKLTRAQLVRISMLTGDAFQALGMVMDAAYSYVLGYGRSTETEKITLKQKILDILRNLDDTQIQVLMSRFEDPADAQLVAGLKEMIGVGKKAVGCLLPLTGQYEVFGQRALHGIELALHQYGVGKGLPIKIILKDTGSDSVKASEKVQELFDEKVACIIGPIVDPQQAATKAQELGIPIIALSQKDGIPDIGDYVFRNFLTPRLQVESLVSYAVENLGFCRFAILYPNETYGRTYMNLFQDEVIRQNGEVVGIQSYEPGQTDFVDPIQKLTGLHPDISPRVREDMLTAMIIRDLEKEKNLKPEIPDMDNPSTYHREDEGFEETEPGEEKENFPYDEDGNLLPIINFEVLFIPDSPKITGLIIPQLAYHDVENVTLFGTNLWHSETLIQMAGSYAQGAVCPEAFFAESESMPVNTFVKSYEDIFDTQPGFFEAISYDTAVILFQILSHPDIVLREEIRDALLDMGIFDGVTGLTAFGENGEVEKKLYLLKLKRNRFIEINR